MATRTGVPRTLGVDAETAVIRFGEEDKGEGASVGRRLMFVNGEPGFELSFWCGTCAPLFERLGGANAKLTIDDLAAILESGVDDLDESVIAAYGDLLEAGTYIPLLIEMNPVLTGPNDDHDYFAHEQVDTFGIDGLWGLPHYPRTRTTERLKPRSVRRLTCMSSSCRWFHRHGMGATLSDELTALCHKQEELLEMWTDGTLTKRELVPARTRIATRIDSTRRQLARLDTGTGLSHFLGDAPSVAAAWDAPDMTLRRQAAVVGAIMSRVVIHPAKKPSNRVDLSRIGPEWIV